MTFYRLLASVALCTIIFSSNTLAKNNENIYEIKAPKECLDKDIVASKEVSLIDLMKIGICNSPSLNADYMLYLEKKENLGSAKSEYFVNFII